MIQIVKRIKHINIITFAAAFVNDKALKRQTFYINSTMLQSSLCIFRHIQAKSTGMFCGLLVLELVSIADFLLKENRQAYFEA